MKLERTQRAICYTARCTTNQLQCAPMPRWPPPPVVQLAISSPVFTSNSSSILSVITRLMKLTLPVDLGECLADLLSRVEGYGTGHRAAVGVAALMRAPCYI